jgi:hypothetical protein
MKDTLLIKFYLHAGPSDGGVGHGVPSHEGRLTHQILSPGRPSDGGAGHGVHSTLQILSSDRRKGGKAGHSGNKDGGSLSQG